MKSFFITKALSGLIILSPIVLLGCEKPTETTGFESTNNQEKNTPSEKKVSEKRTFLKEPPLEQERDRWEDEFLDSVPKDFDVNELEKLQEQILQGGGDIKKLEEEFRKSQQEYNGRH